MSAGSQKSAGGLETSGCSSSAPWTTENPRIPTGNPKSSSRGDDQVTVSSTLS